MNTFLFFQALLTLFISGGLFFKEKNLKNKSIALYFVVFSLEILYFLYSTTEISNLYTSFVGLFYFSMGLMYGPILYIHFQTVSTKKKQLYWLDFLHLLPLVFLNVYMLDLLLMPLSERIDYFNNITHFFNRIIYINYARALHQIIYAVLLFLIFKRYRNEMNINEKFYLSGTLIIYIFTTITITSLTVFASGWRDFSWYYLMNNMLVLLMVYVLYKNPKFFKKIKAKYQGSYINEEQLNIIKSRIEHLLINEQLYLINDLSIQKLAIKLDVKSHYISQTFTYIFKENFNDHINRHRVEHSQKLLKDGAYNNYKIEAIAQDSGFNNKVTFYKAFAKFTDTTPSQYRKGKSKL